MFGSTRFKWLHGSYAHLSILTFPDSLDLSDDDADLGTVKRGKLMQFAANSDVNMNYAGIDGFLGLLISEVNALGVTGDEGFKNFTIGKIDLPIKRGSKVGLRQPHPGSFAEFQGVGANGIDTLVTTTGPGAIVSGTGPGVALTAENGAWRQADVDELVFARTLRTNLTPTVSGEVRIRVEFVSAYPHQPAGTA